MKSTKYKVHNMQYKQGITVQLATSNRERFRWSHGKLTSHSTV